MRRTIRNQWLMLLYLFTRLSPPNQRNWFILRTMKFQLHHFTTRVIFT